MREKFRKFLHEHLHLWHRRREKAWAGLSILVFPEMSSAPPHRLRINYYILFFLIALVVTVTLSGAVLWLGRQFETVQSVSSIERRKVLLSNFHLLLTEKQELLQRSREQIRSFREISWKDSNDLDNYIDSRVSPEISEDPGVASRLQQDLIALRDLNQKSEVVLGTAAHHGLHMIWNRAYLNWVMPRGRPMMPGVGSISSGFGGRKDPFGRATKGDFHTGVDFAAAPGTPIIATAPGMIMQTVEESRSGYGIYVRVHHGFGISTLYAHCSELAVKEGQRVDRGDVIAYVGATGSATGHHLHYEVRFGSEPGRNPAPFISLK
ncbi:MAG: M23 family metallopeptidase [Leptospiraceae bacterium]|nr:M23 family metallopeptidase [Leptospiraceae bacterium]